RRYQFCSQLKEAMPAVTAVKGDLHPVYFPDVIREEPIDVMAQGAELSFPEPSPVFRSYDCWLKPRVVG
ncbi:MAG: hypothetical protein WBV23_12095, partial [Desulfobaccales bacterium]